MIDSNTFDPHFKFLIASEPGGENIKKCFSCGTCTGGCPVREVTDRYNPRKIIRMAILGMKKEVLSSQFIWLCSSCYTCFERCPRKVPTTDVIIELRNMAARKGAMRPPHVALAKMLADTGHGVPINEATQKLRELLGLPKNPPTTHSYPKAVKDIQVLLKSLGFDKLVGWTDQPKPAENKPPAEAKPPAKDEKKEKK